MYFSLQKCILCTFWGNAFVVEELPTKAFRRDLKPFYFVCLFEVGVFIDSKMPSSQVILAASFLKIIL